MATPTFGHLNSPRGAVQAQNWDWDQALLDWVPSTGAPVVGVTGPISIADGADIAEGATTDAAVVTDTTGTVSGKLRGLVKWAYERMPVSLGQKTMAESFPIAIASNQSSIPVSASQGPASVTPWSIYIPPLFYTGSISALNGTVGGITNGHGVASVTVTNNSFMGTLIFEVGIDVLVGLPVSGMNAITGAVSGSPSLDNAIWVVPVASYGVFRVRASAYTSGSVDIEIGLGTGAVDLPVGTQAVSGTVSVTEPVSVDDNAGSLTVDAVDLDIRNLAFATDKVDASGSSLGASSANIGDVDVVSSVLPTGASTSALQLPDGHNVTIDNAAGASAVNVQDGGNSLTVDGTVTDGGAGKTLKTSSFSLSATGTVISAVASKRLKAYAVKLVVSAAISVNWRDGASTDLEGAQSLAANGGYVEAVNPPTFLFATAAGNTLDLVISGSGTAAGRVSYWDDDAV